MNQVLKDHLVPEVKPDLEENQEHLDPLDHEVKEVNLVLMELLDKLVLLDLLVHEDHPDNVVSQEQEEKLDLEENQVSFDMSSLLC